MPSKGSYFLSLEQKLLFVSKRVNFLKDFATRKISLYWASGDWVEGKKTQMSIMKYSCQRDQISPAALLSLSRLSLFPPHKNCFPGGLGKSHSVSVKKVMALSYSPGEAMNFSLQEGGAPKRHVFTAF